MIVALLLAFQIGLGGQAGLNGSPSNAPVISAVTESHDATTVVLQWTTNIASNSMAHCGTEQAVDNNLAADSTTHEIVVAGLAPSTAYTCTVISGSSFTTINATTAALAASTPITGVSVGSITAGSIGNGDTHYNCVSNDGLTYFGLDDVFPTGISGAQSSAVSFAKFTNLSTLTAASVNTLPGYNLSGTTSKGQDGFSPKEDGVLCMGGSIYMPIARILESSVTQPQYAEQIVASHDHGATWNTFQNPSIFTSTGAETFPASLTVFPNTANAPTNFSCSGFVVYGADDGTLGYTVAANRVDNANAYVYLVSDGTGSNNGGCNYNNGSNLYLLRFPRAVLASNVQLTPYQPECWVSGDGTLDANWTTNLANCGAALTNSGEMGLISEEYIPALNRYLMMTFYYPNRLGNAADCVWLAYDAPHPWGPYTLVSTITWSTQGYYNPIPVQSDVLSAAATGTNFRIMFTGNFTNSSTYKMYWATLTVTP